MRRKKRPSAAWFRDGKAELFLFFFLIFSILLLGPEDKRIYLREDKRGYPGTSPDHSSSIVPGGLLVTS